MLKFMLAVLFVVGLCVGGTTAMAAPGVSDLSVGVSSVISLDSPDWEFSTLFVATPKITGVGGSVSYRLIDIHTGSNGFWADAGALKYNGTTNLLAGVSTDMPFGGKLLENNTRIGLWYLFDEGTVVGGVRIPF